VEARKYSTGTKGRLKMHADQCREAIRANAPNFHLAVEFIDSIDSEREDRVWQRFQTPEDVLPELEAWLSGGEMPVEKTKSLVVPASRLAVPDTKRVEIVKEARGWVEKNSAELSALTPIEAIERVLSHIENRE
jgi:hypothetical protein